MVDEALKNAITRQDQLAASINEHAQKLEELRKELERVRSFIADWHNFAGKSPDLEPDQKQDILSATLNAGSGLKAAGRKTFRNPARAKIASETRDIIRERGTPIPRSELYEALAARGIKIQGKDPQMVLSTMLWRSKDEVVRLPGHGYWLTGVPYEEAGYTGLDPHDEPDHVGKDDDLAV